MKMNLSMQMLVATVLGAAAGLVLQTAGAADMARVYIAPIGTLFLNLIQMIIIPLIFSTLVTGVYEIDNIKKYGSIGAKTIAAFFIMTLISTAIGLGVAEIFGVGKGVSYEAAGGVTVPPAVSVIKTIINFVPSNIYKALSSGDMVAIVVFGVFLGIGMICSKEAARPLYDVLTAVKTAISNITSFIMKLAPIGIFAIVTETMAVNGIDMLLSMAGLIIVVYIGFLLNNLLVYGGCAALSGTGIGNFYKATFGALVFAFTSQTSAAAIPFENEALDRLKVSETVKSFVIPLGNAMHKNGTALYQCVFTVFLANYYGIEISPSLFISVMIAATVSAMGTAGIPQGGMVTLGMVLAAAGVPVEGVSLVAGLIAIIGMGSTANNVGGDMAAAVVVDKHK